MEEKSKGFSLRRKRTKRPKISGPKNFTHTSSSRDAEKTTTGENGLLAVPRERLQQGGAAADLVKRRYSARVTTLPNESGDIPPVPAVPAIPDQFTQASGSRPSFQGDRPSGGKTITIDIQALRDPNLRPEKYVTGLLSEASEQDIREYQRNLQRVKTRTSTDLQQNVFQNRTQFIRISKEAEKLKGEMRTLRGLMSELTTSLTQTTSTNGSANSDNRSFDVGISRKHSNRSSIANLEAMWNTQLQSLWKNVEGSQKFLPAIPGRHIVKESGHWVELNAATWKPRRAVHIFLLNDHLLVATRKKKRVDPSQQSAMEQKQPVPSKLVAERCWPLQDIDMVDLASGTSGRPTDDSRTPKQDVANTISIRVGQESFTYRSDKGDSNEKSSLLLTFRKTADELRKTMRAENEDASRKRDSMNLFATRDPGLLRQGDILETLSNSYKDRPDLMIDVDGKQQRFSWVENQIDELDIEIALQRFDEAVARVDKLRTLAKGLKSNLIAQGLINTKVDERALKLAELIATQLADTHSFQKATQRNTGWLTRLGFEDRAREVFLQSRSEVLAKRARQCVFEGDFNLYMFQISYVCFKIMKNTASIYQACFPPAMMSACVKWAKERLDDFNTILLRQLSSVEPHGSVWNECMETARDQALMLKEVGLDFEDLVGLEPEIDDTR